MCRVYSLLIPHSLLMAAMFFLLATAQFGQQQRHFNSNPALQTGSMDTACAKPLTVTFGDSTYAKADLMQSLKPGIALQNNYYPVNCITTAGNKPCNGCRPLQVQLESTVYAYRPVGGNATCFTATASAFNTGHNSQFVVSQVNGLLADIPGTILTCPPGVGLPLLPASTSITAQVWRAQTHQVSLLQVLPTGKAYSSAYNIAARW